jgi:hypothetical protein
VDHFHPIYAHCAADYHRMIAPEDADSSLLKALQKITSLRGRLPEWTGVWSKEAYGVW